MVAVLCAVVPGDRASARKTQGPKTLRFTRCAWGEGSRLSLCSDPDDGGSLLPALDFHQQALGAGVLDAVTSLVPSCMSRSVLVMVMHDTLMVEAMGSGLAKT
jgi:hypothetical protein